MVAAFGFLDPVEVLVEILLVGPGGAVDALQLRIARVAAPIGASHVHQLEGLAEMPGRGQMRPDAQIDEIALAVEADLLFRRDLRDIFGLVALAEAFEQRHGGIAVPDFAGDRFIAAHDVAHPRLDPGEILRGEGLLRAKS